LLKRLTLTLAQILLLVFWKAKVQYFYGCHIRKNIVQSVTRANAFALEAVHQLFMNVYRLIQVIGGKIMATTTQQNRLLRFLKEELLLPNDAIDLALRHTIKSSGSLPIILWQYGLITLDQLSSIYDWLETA
jgi:Protein of unknown function (DUF2949)